MHANPDSLFFFYNILNHIQIIERSLGEHQERIQDIHASKPPTAIDRTSPAHVGILINAVDYTVFHKTHWILPPQTVRVTYVKDGP